MQMARQLQQLVTYVQRQWIDTGNTTTSTDLSDTSNRCEVCLSQPRAGVALHGTMRAFAFLSHCADTVASVDSECPICRTPVMVLRLYAWLCRACTLNGRLLSVVGSPFSGPSLLVPHFQVLHFSTPTFSVDPLTQI